MRNSVTPAIIELARQIRLAAFDVDGTMSDGTLAYGDDGSEAKAFHTLDGQGLKLLGGAGVQLAIVSARHSTVVQRRARELGIEHVIQGSPDKVAAITALAAEQRLTLTQCAFMGDDLGDLAPLRACGLGCSVPAAPLQVRAGAHYVTRCAAGAGAVREFCELLLRARGRPVADHAAL